MMLYYIICILIQVIFSCIQRFWVFENIEKGVYFDKVHLNNLGNKIIAEKIYEKILPIVLKDLKNN